MKLFKIEYRKKGRVIETHFKIYTSAEMAKAESYRHAERIGTGINITRIF